MKIKRLQSVLFALIILICIIPLSSAVKPPGILMAPYADVNENGFVDSQDALAIMQYCVGNYGLTEQGKIMADVDKNGKIEVADAFLLLQYITFQQVFIDPEESSDEPSDPGIIIEKPTNVLANGVDVSKWQGDAINWSTVKASGIDYAILRIGYGKYSAQIDPCFEKNYSGCRAAGLDIGVYHFSYAETVADARLEAQVCINWLNGRKLEYPVFYDMESKTTLGVTLTTQIAEAFCSELKAAGYCVGLYSYANFLKNNLTTEIRDKYHVWVAHFNVSSPSYNRAYTMWQYTSSGSVGGIAGRVDMNYCYYDFPTHIKTSHLSGY